MAFIIFQFFNCCMGISLSVIGWLISRFTLFVFSSVLFTLISSSPSYIFSTFMFLTCSYKSFKGAFVCLLLFIELIIFQNSLGFAFFFNFSTSKILSFLYSLACFFFFFFFFFFFYKTFLYSLLIDFNCSL